MPSVSHHAYDNACLLLGLGFCTGEVPRKLLDDIGSHLDHGATCSACAKDRRRKRPRDVGEVNLFAHYLAHKSEDLARAVIGGRTVEGVVERIGKKYPARSLTQCIRAFRRAARQKAKAAQQKARNVVGIKAA